MPGKLEVLGILLVLLPGFLAAYLVQQLSVRREQTDFEKVIEALVFSFVLYVLTVPFFGWRLPLSWRQAQDGSYTILGNSTHVVVLLIVSTIFGAGYASTINHDWLHRIFRKLRITERTARRSIWNDAFQELGGFAQVQLKDGKRIIGWVRYYSDQAEDASLFLEKAAWIEDDSSEKSIDGPGILLTKESGIESVMFLNWTTSDQAAPAPSELDKAS